MSIREDSKDINSSDDKSGDKYHNQNQNRNHKSNCLRLSGHVDEYLGGKLTFLNWSGYCLPTVFIFLAIAWVWLQIWFQGIKGVVKLGSASKVGCDGKSSLLGYCCTVKGAIAFMKLIVR